MIGTMQYGHTLPLEDHEVVLTFDDGPLPRNSNQILQILADQCVKATFFTIGAQANANPEGVRKVRDAGHTVATHTQNHPSNMQRLPIDRAIKEIDDGIASVTAALGDGSAPAPFFRIPGLARTTRSRNMWPRRASSSGAPIFRPTTGAMSRRSASMISRSSGWKPREKASCCCTTFSRAQSSRCPASCMS